MLSSSRTIHLCPRCGQRFMMNGPTPILLPLTSLIHQPSDRDQCYSVIGVLEIDKPTWLDHPGQGMPYVTSRWALASTAVGGDCYSLGYSITRACSDRLLYGHASAHTVIASIRRPRSAKGRAMTRAVCRRREHPSPLLPRGRSPLWPHGTQQTYSTSPLVRRGPTPNPHP